MKSKINSSVTSGLALVSGLTVCWWALAAVTPPHSVTPSVTPKAARYQIHVLGTLPKINNSSNDYSSLPSSSSGALNDKQQIAGDSYRGRHNNQACIYAFLWSPGHMRNLGSPIDSSGSQCISLTMSEDINNRGEVVGAWWPSPVREIRAFLWSRGKMHDLNAGSGSNRKQPSSEATAINDQSQIVGWVENQEKRHAAFWKNGQMTDLGTLPGDAESEASGINNLGQIVGRSGTYGGHYRAFLWQNGKMEAVGPITKNSSAATAINDKGQIVIHTGTALNAMYGARYVWLWQNGKGTQLKTFGGDLTFARAINNRGQIVGRGSAPGDDHFAVMWENGKIYDLHHLVPARSSWLLLDARDINDKGQIVVNGDLNGKQRVLLLQ